MGEHDNKHLVVPGGTLILEEVYEAADECDCTLAAEVVVDVVLVSLYSNQVYPRFLLMPAGLASRLNLLWEVNLVVEAGNFELEVDMVLSLLAFDL